MHALCLNTLAVRLLALFLKAEVHGQRFLLRLLLGLNRSPERVGKLYVAQENALNHDAAWLQGGFQSCSDFVFHLLA